MRKFNVDDLIEKGLVRARKYTTGPYSGLQVIKYNRKIHFSNKWNDDPRLVECRGIVVDSDHNVILHPFTKIFNRFENGTELDRDRLVMFAQKKNGFMAGATLYNGEWLVSTTGTLDSDYAVLARTVIDFEHCPELVNDPFWETVDLLFEICDLSDPHIVYEEPGAYLIGAREKTTGRMLSEIELDDIRIGNWKRPEWGEGRYGDVVKLAAKCRHEGFVVRDVDTGELLLKIKSPHYLAKKFLMRGTEQLGAVWDHFEQARKRVDEEYYPLLDYVRSSFSRTAWLLLTEQERRIVIENYFNGVTTVEPIPSHPAVDVPKMLYIIRGCSGSGKTTFATTLQQSLNAVKFEVDDHMYINGVYVFNGRKLPAAWANFTSNLTEAMKQQLPKIIVSNTSCQAKEMELLLDMAELYGYEVTSLVVENRHGSTSIHDVEEYKLARQETALRNSLKLR